jgi:hypothetical protein
MFHHLLGGVLVCVNFMLFNCFPFVELNMEAYKGVKPRKSLNMIAFISSPDVQNKIAVHSNTIFAIFSNRFSDSVFLIFFLF